MVDLFGNGGNHRSGHEVDDGGSNDHTDRVVRFDDGEVDSPGPTTTTKPKKKSTSKNNIGGSFQSLNLTEEVYRGIVHMGYRVPTPVQRRALPVCLEFDRDVVAMARTGSGKTAAFAVPILDQLWRAYNDHSERSTSFSSAETGGQGIGAVIISPTRELALQTLSVFQKLGKFCRPLRAVGIVGADSMEKQFEALCGGSGGLDGTGAKRPPDVLVATPGRLAHHLTELPKHLTDRLFRFKCKALVLDEADRLMEMGFAHQIREICKCLPPSTVCRRWLFSATMPTVLAEFTRASTGLDLSDPVVVRLDSEAKLSDELRVGFFACRTEEKDGLLLHVVRDMLKAGETTAKLAATTSTSSNGVLPGKHRGKKSKKGKAANRDRADEGTGDHNHNHNGDDNGNGNDNDTPPSRSYEKRRTLVFCATRHHVEYVTALLRAVGVDAAMVYGTMDLEARKQALANFRSTHKPTTVLVVTDVAARGIDVPLIENVVHHSFPPEPKLFVHRSGRAARAGRIGHCFGLVDPEEMPYLVDLHVFLGWKLSTSPSNKRQTLDDMVPDEVFYGSVPEDVTTNGMEEVQRLLDGGIVIRPCVSGSGVEGSATATEDRDGDLTALQRVSRNAMKQYRRSRPEASKSSVRRAKAIRDGEGGRAMPLHPLFFSDDGDMAQRRQEFLLAMARFRPKETIFEAFATGGSGSSTANVGNQGDVSSKERRNAVAYTSEALQATKSMRRQVRLVRDGQSSNLVVAGSTSASASASSTLPQTEEKEKANGDNTETPTRNEVLTSASSNTAPTAEIEVTTTAASKARMSKAERRRRKKDGTGTSGGGGASSNGERLPPPTTTTSDPDETDRPHDYRDQQFYIDVVSRGGIASERGARVEAALQPSASSSKDAKTRALRMEELLLDVHGDEHADLVHRRRTVRWDKSKRKYIASTLGEDLGGSKKLRTESGATVRATQAKVGEIFRKWQTKNQRAANAAAHSLALEDDGHLGGLGVGGGGGGANDRDVRRLQEEARRQNQTATGKAGTRRSQKEQLEFDRGAAGVKSSVQIRKERKLAEANRIKNMNKKDRARVLLARKKKARAATAATLSKSPKFSKSRAAPRRKRG